MSNVVCFPPKRPTLSCLDGGRDGLFVLYTDEQPSGAFGPFDEAAAREFATNISGQSGGRILIDWDSFPYRPDPKNGEVYATEWCQHHCQEESEATGPRDFAVVHMSQYGDSADVRRGFVTLETAQAEASRLARELNAVLTASNDVSPQGIVAPEVNDLKSIKPPRGVH